MKMDLRRKNLAVAAACMSAIGVMTGIVAYSPTLYRLFCAATGYGGTSKEPNPAPAANCQGAIRYECRAESAVAL
jgi:cytochrome c oxidase assembly protein Cox11